MNRPPSHGIGLAIALLAFPITNPAWAQIKADPSANTQVQRTNNSRYQITGGKRSNGNLFHSFQEFSIPEQQSAKFVLKPTDSITHIYARVTGANRSLINGTLLSDGQAHVILLNPNGITFGQNARFNLGGSFLGTTGQSIQFANGQQLTPTQNVQLLRVTTPVGIQLGSNPGSIQNRSKRTQNTRLSLPNNQHFALVGGDIQFLGGNITVPNGTISLAAVGPEQTVKLNPFASEQLLNLDGVTKFQNLTFNDQAFLRTLSNQASPNVGPQGAIQLWGNDANLNNLIRLRSSINQDIQLTLTGTLSLNDRSKILSDTTSKLGSGDINIQAARITLQDGSQINASVSGEGIGGDITINVQDSITITDISPITRESSAILSDGFQEGTGGNIQITAPTIQLK